MMAVWSEVPLHALSKDFRIDADYYRPDVLALRQSIERSNHRVSRLEDVSDSIINFGAYSLCNNISFTETGVRFITAENILDGHIDYESARHIPFEQHQGLLWKSQVQKGQVLVAMAARLGYAAVYDQSDCLNSSQDVAKVSLKDHDQTNPYYVAAFINSRLGRDQLNASQSGSVQQHTNLGKIKDLQVVILPRQTQRLISEKYLQALSEREKAHALYTQAEGLLLSGLGLGELDLSPTLFYECPFSETQQTARLDAEFFQPAYQRVVDICSSYKGGAETLDALLESMTNGVECREFVDEGTPYIRVGDMGKLRIRSSDAVRISQQDASRLSSKIVLRQGDVLTARSGSIGQACVVTENDEASILSSHIMRLRPRKECPVLSDCLALFLATLPGIQQVLKNGNGGIVPEISQPFMKRVVVPIIAKRTQKRLSEMIGESLQAEDASRRLLEEAKRMVEEAVLGGLPGEE